MNCPLCGTLVPLIETSCPKCRSNLTEYLQVYYMPDRLFNEALPMMRKGRFGEAAELLCQAAALRPDDKEILLAWAESCARAGDHAAASRVMEKALDRFSNDDTVVEMFQRETELAEGESL